MSHALRARDYIQHMVDASKRIELYINLKTQDAFLSEPLVQDAVIRNIEILGEAAKNLMGVLPDASTQFPSVPWKAMYVTRNRITHGYFTINLKTIWEVGTVEVPVVREKLELCLAAWPANLI